MAESDGAFLEEFEPDERSELGSLRFATVVGRFYEDLAQRLTFGAEAGFELAGVSAEQVEHHSVPGAYELPLAAKYCAESGRYDGVCALGAVIRGETSHYDHVVEECARGLMEVQLTTGVPCGFGVLTVENHDQAVARSGGGKRDSGLHAAEAVLQMARIRAELASG